jgi:hypothetical protein
VKVAYQSLSACPRGPFSTVKNKLSRSQTECDCVPAANPSVLIGGLKELLRSEVFSVLNYLDKVDIISEGKT